MTICDSMHLGKEVIWKKILSMFPVMVALLVLALGGLGLYIGLLARPVSYGMPYTYSQTLEGTGYEEVDGQTQNVTINFESDEKAVLKMEMNGEVSELTYWTVRNGNKVWFVADANSFTYEQFKEAIKEIKADANEWDAIWSEDSSDIQILHVNAFEISSNLSPDTFKCTGAIVFAAVWGVVEVALIAVAALSLTFYLKGKKQESKPAETEQQ